MRRRGETLDIGEALSEARNARGLTIEQAAQDTRISLRFLEALEAEQFEELPAPVYVRGFTRSYANYLGIDAQPLVDELALREFGGGYSAHPESETFYASASRGGQRPASSANPFKPRAPQPAARSTNITAFPAGRATNPPPAGEVDGYDTGDAPDDVERDDVYYDDWTPPVDRRPSRDEQRTAGLLLERESAGGTGGRRGGLVIAGLALAGIGALAAVFMMGGDGAPTALADTTPTTTSTSPGNVIEVRTPTPAPTDAATTRTITPAGTGTVTTTPGPGATGTVTATLVPGISTSIGNPSTPTPVAPTPTDAPARATPTFTPTVERPTPTATPIVHPLTYSECLPLSGGERFCGTAPYLVICGPNGWFVDRNRDYPNPGWPTRELTLLTNVETECAAP